MYHDKQLNHTTWECKYHLVWIPKYRKKAIYGELRKYLGEVFRELALQKESSIIEGHLMGDHVHILISIPPKYAVSQVVGYIKGKSYSHKIQLDSTMSVSYKARNAILDHFFMTTLLFFILTYKNQKIIRSLKPKYYGLHCLLVKNKIHGCNLSTVLIKYCKYLGHLEYICNTLSGGVGTYGQNTRPEADFSLSGQQMLDDPTTGRAYELFHTFGSTVPGQNRLFQQLYPQREMVHSGLYSPFQQQGLVVLPGYRVFKAWFADPYTGESGREKFIRDDSRSTGTTASMPLPCRSGPIVPQRAVAKTKAWWFLCVLGFRSDQSRCSGKSASN